LLEKVTFFTFDDSMKFHKGKHWLFDMREEDMVNIDDDCDNRRTINGSYLDVFCMDPKTETMRLENLEPKHARQLAIDIDFKLGRNVTPLQHNIIDNISNHLDDVTKGMKCLNRIAFCFSVEASVEAETQLHTVLTSILRVQLKEHSTLSLNFMSLTFEDANDQNNQTMSLKPLPVNNQVTILEISDWNDLKNSKLVTRRIFDSIPNVTEVRYDAKISYYLPELLELLTNFGELSFLEIIISHYPWRSELEEVRNADTFHRAMTILSEQFSLKTEVILKQIWFDENFEEIESCTVITKKPGSLPEMNPYAFMPFIQDTLDQEPNESLTFLDGLPYLFMENEKLVL